MSITSKIVNYTFKRSDQKRDRGLKTPPEIVRVDDLSYGPHGIDNTLDYYFPKHSTKPLPVLVNVHGGGWVYGTKETYQYYCMALAKRGFVVVNFNYRLAPKHQFPAQMEDVHSVFEWLMKQDQSRFDLNNIFIIGDSAGAHLASLYISFCTNQEYQAEYDFQPIPTIKLMGAVLNCGIYDLEKALKEDKMLRTLIQDLLGKNPSKSLMQKVNPVKWITSGYIPTTIMTATGDFLYHQAPLMQEALNKQNIKHELQIYGDDVERLFHDFQCNIKTEDAYKCNVAQMDFLHSLIDGTWNENEKSINSKNA